MLMAISRLLFPEAFAPKMVATRSAKTPSIGVPSNVSSCSGARVLAATREIGSVLLIDELESSLHTQMARYLVKMFNDPQLNPRGAQLIFATHNPIFLDPDLLRRDQIWIAEKSDEGVSEFHSLAEFKPRKGQNLMASYLNGRFGGVPFLDEDAIVNAVLRPPESQASTVTQDGKV